MDDVDLLYSIETSKFHGDVLPKKKVAKGKKTQKLPSIRILLLRPTKKLHLSTFIQKEHSLTKKQFKGVTWMSCWKLVNGYIMNGL